MAWSEGLGHPKPAFTLLLRRPELSLTIGTRVAISNRLLSVSSSTKDSFFRHLVKYGFLLKTRDQVGLGKSVVLSDYII